MKICDVSNPNEINVNTTFLSNVDSESIAHNLIIKDNYVYVSHYHDGLYIWDISDPSNPVVAGSFDTYLPEDHSSYRGAWGVYPLLPSGNILVSDMQAGLFVLSPLQNQNSNLNDIENNILIFPNPFVDEINIKTTNLKSGCWMEIVNINGKIIFKKEISNGNYKIPKKLKSGVYFARLKFEDKIEIQKNW